MSSWRPVNRLIAAHGLSTFCFGLVFPYTAIYLSDLPAVGTAGVAVFYACTGGANVAMALLLTTGVVRLSRIRLGMLGTLLWFAGYLGMFAVGSFPAVVASALGIGAGQGCILAAMVPIINSLITADERRAVFARRYAVQNATAALGSLAAGVLTLVLPRGVISYFFLANAVGVLPLTLSIFASRRHVPAGAGQAGGAEGGPALSAVVLGRLALPAVLVQLAAFLFGFSQFEATAPLVAEKLMDMGLAAVSLLMVVNVVAITSAQRPVTRLLESRSERFGLHVAIVLWVAGYVVAGVTSFGDFGVRLAGLLLYAVLFGLGECAYSCSFHPWLISMVPDRELTRASALVNSMMGIGNFAGPSIGVGLALTGNAPVVWLGLAVCCTLVTATMRLSARRTSPASLGA